MGLPLAIVAVLGGFVLLAGGGEILVRGAVSTARRLNVSTAIIGLTIVAMATSLPELAVSVTAALRGSPDVAVGNVVGSNIFNLAAILGITAILFPPLRFRVKMIRFDVIVMTLSAVMAVIVSRGGRTVTRFEGIVFLVLLAAFLVYRTRQARVQDVPEGEGDEGEIESELHSSRSERLPFALGLVLLGAGLLTAGAQILVGGAVEIARIANVSERVIALTLVSAGTGLPELATAVMAGRRKHTAVAVGNVIGSNIFNVFGILGTVAIITPVHVSERLAAGDMWWMLGFCLVALFAVFHRGQRISRFEGIVALAIYVLYLLTLL